MNLLCGLDLLAEFSAFCYDIISCSLIVSGYAQHSVYTSSTKFCEFVYTGGHQMSGERGGGESVLTLI